MGEEHSFEVVDGDEGVKVVKRDGEPTVTYTFDGPKARLRVVGTRTIRRIATVLDGESISVREAIENGLAPEGLLE